MPTHGSIKIEPLMNSLFDWSIDGTNITTEIRNRPFEQYISWKVPFPMESLNGHPKYRAISAFCVERVFVKLKLVNDVMRHEMKEFPSIRKYCILTCPNLFFSEVGVIFSKEKWDELLFRNVEQKNYMEKTEPCEHTVWEDFGINLPCWTSCISMSHSINDVDEETSFKGHFHAVWVKGDDLPP